MFDWIGTTNSCGMLAAVARGVGHCRKHLDLPMTEAEISVVRISKTPVMVLLVASNPFCLFAGGIPVYVPNPVGEKLFRAYLLHETLPVFIVMLGLAIAGIIHSLLRRTQKPQPPNWSPAIRFM